MQFLLKIIIVLFMIVVLSAEREVHASNLGAPHTGAWQQISDQLQGYIDNLQVMIQAFITQFGDVVGQVSEQFADVLARIQAYLQRIVDLYSQWIEKKA